MLDVSRDPDEPDAGMASKRRNELEWHAFAATYSQPVHICSCWCCARFTQAVKEAEEAGKRTQEAEARAQAAARGEAEARARAEDLKGQVREGRGRDTC